MPKNFIATSQRTTFSKLQKFWYSIHLFIPFKKLRLYVKIVLFVFEKLCSFVLTLFKIYKKKLLYKNCFKCRHKTGSKICEYILK